MVSRGCPRLAHRASWIERGSAPWTRRGQPHRRCATSPRPILGREHLRMQDHNGDASCKGNVVLGREASGGRGGRLAGTASQARAASSSGRSAAAAHGRREQGGRASATRGSRTAAAAPSGRAARFLSRCAFSGGCRRWFWDARVRDCDNPISDACPLSGTRRSRRGRGRSTGSRRVPTRPRVGSRPEPVRRTTAPPVPMSPHYSAATR